MFSRSTLFSTAKIEGVLLDLFSQYLLVIFEQSREVFGIAKIGCDVVLRSELLVVVDEVGCVKWLRVFIFEGCGSAIK